MASASLTDPSPRPARLNEHQRSALSGCLSHILAEISPHLESDTDFSDAMSALIDEVRSLCAPFASQFNDRNPRAVTSRLPVELLTACLYAADIPTRIRTSHVSRSLRALALGERGLWTVYRCRSMPFMGEGLRSSLDFLEAVLRRSDPLPIRLEIGHIYVFGNDPYASEVAAILTPNLHQLQVYDGTSYVFDQLNPDGAPVQSLMSLDVVGDGMCCCGDLFDVGGAFRPQCLPNLRRLVVPVPDFQGQYYNNLREIVCTVTSEVSDDVFRYCPNLVHAEFRGWQTSQLPRGPVPRSIREITIHCEPCGQHRPDGIDIAALRVWAAEFIPKLVLIGTQSLDAIVRELLVAHNEPTRLTVSAHGVEPDVVLSAADPTRWCWAVRTRDFWGSPHFASDFRQLFTAVQITALCIGIDMLGALLIARVYAPHLLSLELSLTGIDRVALFEALSECHCLHAQGLQHFVLDVGATNAGARADGINDALELLAQNFRRLIVYDAELLETVTVRSSARTAAGTDCASFARFASRYVELRRP